MLPSIEKDNELIARHLAGRYVIGELLCETPVSRVYGATAISDASSVAIKISPIGHRINRNTEPALLHRLGAVSAIKHPHLVQTIGFALDREGELIIQVMEYIEGSPILDLIHVPGSPLTIGRAVELLGQIAAGIDALHEAGLIHRDIKPQNILYRDRDQSAVLADFGAAISRAHFDVDREAACGTPAYVAPEQVIGTSFGPVVDVYAFGVVVYNVLTRTLPFDCKSAQEHLYAHVHIDPVPIRRRNRNWPTDLERALDRALSHDPHKRPTTAGELAADIRASLQPFTPIKLASFYDGTFARMSSGEVPINF